MKPSHRTCRTCRTCRSYRTGRCGLALVAIAALAAGADAATGRVERQLTMMGTGLRVTVDASSRERALAASEAAVSALERTELRLSTWSDHSELARLNRARVGRAVPLSPELAADLRAGWRCAELTEGAFEPTVGSLVEAWALRRGGRVPTAEDLTRARATAGRDLIRFAADAATATRLDPGVRIEEGGFGKGAGLDRAVAAARDAGATRVVLDLGGQLAWSATPAATEDGLAADIADPRARARPALSVRFDPGSIATSGNSERGFDIDGRRYGHILDPRSGRPALDFGSLTVWHRSAVLADCLATGLYVLGADAALAWAERHDGVEVVVLEPGPDGPIARATPGLTGRLTPRSPDVTIIATPSGGRR